MEKNDNWPQLKRNESKIILAHHRNCWENQKGLFPLIFVKRSAGNKPVPLQRRVK